MQPNHIRVFVAFLSITLVALGPSAISLGHAQDAADLVSLSYQAFEQIAAIYRAGGSAPELVAKLNDALGELQEAQAKRANGDEAAAAQLEAASRSTITEILGQIPGARLTAERTANARTLNVVAFAAIADLLIIVISFVLLRLWRSYEKWRLYEMRIIEKKVED